VSVYSVLFTMLLAVPCHWETSNCMEYTSVLWRPTIYGSGTLWPSVV